MPVFFQQVYHSQGLFIMSEAMVVEFIQNLLPHVPEGGMPQVVSQADGLGQVFIESEGAGYSPAYLGNLQGMSEAGYIVVTQWSDKNLRLMFKTAKSLAVDNAIPVTLKSGTYRTGLFRS